ncbi:MAG: hypothetical protein Q7S16_05465 [bacterium]|nr:hypothetical protein [bacterium]
MTLNLLSNEKDIADTAATKKSGAPSPVAFRIPASENPLPIAKTTLGVGSTPSVYTPAPPIVKKQNEGKGFTPLEAGRPKAAVAVPSAGRLLTGFTKPEVLHEGFGVNILGSTTEHEAKIPSLAIMIMTMIGAFLGTVLVLGVWLMLMNEEEGRVAASVQTEKMTLAALKRTMEEMKEERKNVTETLGTIETARALLTRHIYWTQFFHFLEAVTLPDVYYTNLAVDPAGNIRLAAIGRNFSAVARQLLAFEGSDDVETIRTTKAAAEISASVPGVQFDLALTVKPKLLFFLENK